VEQRLTIRALGAPGDLGWVVMANGQLYAREFGWNTDCEALFARIVADFAAAGDHEQSRGWIAELDGDRVGSVLCMSGDDPAVARLRLLLVEPKARGRQLGFRLVGTAIEFATAAGYERMTLWTNHPLVAARRIYLRHGFRLTHEEPHHSFGVDLIGQTYELELPSS
jgi:GNAT superfamily N-acetyltransferase